ncbi:diversity-generating retroelement protein Avd [Spirulina major CS-329]|uniref:diversity-generating retroelement protein Avd n=1 Tax=Spirulina TaxID=1154 RepID=UPI00232CDC21|nr:MULTISPECIES: diversity-generating retroelement protein Avd [Spirulina]MDB9494390.1 diversity-generating retroelement protein Avd [Spirulina subsalsa CS-330]MDB9503957.1 diversity-generating retroelement protein Avd [Spirulina major CS-329]
MDELPIIQKTYDLIQWYVPILNHLPRDHKMVLGDRIIRNLYEFLEILILARYSAQKHDLLRSLNPKLSILRYQTRLLMDFKLISVERYEYIAKQIDSIGKELGGWINQQSPKPAKTT